MWAEDKGPGIANISMAMKDYFTTGNTLGLGLPGVRRMADEFAMESESEENMIVYVRKRIRGNKNDIDLTRSISSIEKNR
ncbi:hypothetical protein [Polynucleobacter necessarius]|uniref:hypothetical protein n=1 Tax=Polynucleobacter necessarius TaxID=576610 RepID=UPI000E09B72C|nr:hypothetical protein [Polynucleobacter necessarius]HAT38709.1 hypothetical protein [Polynucleobacter sp.]